MPPHGPHRWRLPNRSVGALSQLRPILFVLFQQLFAGARQIHTTFLPID
jgi:hypothetical protein